MVHFIVTDTNEFPNNTWREFITNRKISNLQNYLPFYVFSYFSVKNESHFEFKIKDITVILWIVMNLKLSS